MTRRRAIGLGGGLAVAIGASEPIFGAVRKAAGADPLRSAPEEARPKVRWWLPGDALDDAVLADQLASLAKAGFGAAEVINMSGEGWGGARWRGHIAQALDSARAKGLKLDLTVGPHWPAAVPGIAEDGPAAAQVLLFGHTVLAPGQHFAGQLPKPPPPKPRPAPPEGSDAPPLPPESGLDLPLRLVGVTAHRLAGPVAGPPPILLERRSAIELTGAVRNGWLRFTAPREGEWVLVAAWQRGSGKTADGVSPVINHFSAAGAAALTGFWDGQLADAAYRKAIFAAGGDWFEDSVELTQHTHWTDDLADELERRRGFSILAHLPVLSILYPHIFTLVPQFDYADGTGQRLRNDYFETLTQLYIEHHQVPLRDWANRHGLKLRQQPAYGVTLNQGRTGGVPDVPETESLWFAEKIDGYRILAGAAHVCGRNVISVETDPVVPPTVGDDAWAVTFPALLNLLHGHFAGGINQIVLHGMPYPEAKGESWPGYGPFQTVGGGLGEAWGAASPIWRHMDQLTGYLARVQGWLREGRPAVDIAVLRRSYWDRGRDNWDGAAGLAWNDAGLSSKGYSHDYVDPGLLLEHGLTFACGRLLPDGPAYRALVIRSGGEAGESPAAPIRSAALTKPEALALLRAAQAGMPCVIVGSLTGQTPFFGDRADDAEISAMGARLLALANVRQVASEADVPQALHALGVLPSAQFLSPCSNVFVTGRKTPEGRTYFLYNQGKESTELGYVGAPVTLRLSLEGEGQVFACDGWNGALRALSSTPSGAGRLEVEVVLPPHAAVVLKAGSRHEARPALLAGGSIETVPLAFRSLDLETWSPPTSGIRPVIASTHHDLVELVPWTALPGGQAIAGIGRYATVHSVTARQARATAIAVELGPVQGSVALTVNGQPVPVDQVAFRADLTGVLRPGTNHFVIEVASTLNNALRALPGGERRALQHPGLIGPVSLVFATP